MDEIERRRRDMFGDVKYDAMAADGLFDPPVIECPESERKVRDEFARESSIEWQLQRFQAGQVPTRVGYSGIYDDSVDLLEAYRLQNEASALWNSTPPEVRKQFGDFGDVLTASKDGRLQEFIRERTKAEVVKDA